MEKKTLNYITFDSWWDTDVTLLPELCKEYKLNVFVEDWTDAAKYPVKEDYGFNKFIIYKAKYRNRDIRRSWGSMKYFFSIMKETRKKDSTTLFILGGDAYLVMLLFILLNPKKTIIASHNYREHVDNRRTAFAFVYRWYYHRFRRFLFFSELQKQNYLNDFPNKDVYSITMPLKDFGKPKKERTDDRVTFLFFGGIRPYKHPEVFINASHKIPADKARFIMVGSGKDWWHKYEPLVKDGDNIELDVRFVDNSEIPDFFNQADFLVLPYEDATQSGPSLIALNYCVPIIATKLPAFEKLIKDGENGYLFDPCDENVLADLFLKIIEKGRPGIDSMRDAMVRAKEEYQSSHNVVDTFRSII